MANIELVLNQAISTFNDIGAALTEKGMATEDTPAIEYAALIRNEIFTYHTVEFIGADGSLLCKKPVFPGDDCKDPVTEKEIETPTKDSDIQYDYDYSGWSLTPNGSVDTDALKNITTNRTVYAAFTGTTKQYTITYLDSDGVTVLGSDILPYGATSPIFKPTKEGYYCSEYIPEFVPVAGDASYIVVWSETISFADATWEEIAQVCASGKAKAMFNIGDTKTVTSLKQGVLPNFTVEIVGFDHDDLADGSGKASISVVTTTVVEPTNYLHYMFHGNNNLEGGWGECHLRTYLNSGALYQCMPEDLLSVVKTVNKKHTKYQRYVSNYSLYDSADKFWLLGRGEIYEDDTMCSLDESKYLVCGNLYEGLSTLEKITQRTRSENRYKAFWLRTTFSKEQVVYVRDDSGYEKPVYTYLAPATYNRSPQPKLVFGFCI